MSGRKNKTSGIGNLEALLSKGKISRREFLARASALGLAATAGPLLLGRPVQAATPKKGGCLRIATAGGMVSDSLDPITIADSMPQMISWQTMNNMVEIDANSEPVPELAESWESSPNAKKWVFKLRRGVEFHNGKTLDAQDVLFSLNRHRGDDSKSPAKVLLDQITEIKSEDKHTLVFMLKNGNADFPFILADHHLQILPNGTTEFQKGIGTGGYILESWEPGVRAFVRRNPNYWKAGRAHFDEVETLGISDVTARVNVLMTGKVDVISRCDNKTFDLLKKKPGIKTLATTGTKHYLLPMRTDKVPYDNNNVRMAMKHAIDREHILKALLRGYGTLGNDHPISPANRYFAKDLPQRQYDPDKARFYLKQAGLENHTFKIHSSDAAFSGAMDLAILYKEHAAKAGIKIDVVREPEDGYWNQIWMKKDWCISYWNGRPTEDLMFSMVYAAGAAWNETFWKSERFNNLLVAARGELDGAKRRDMYAEMQRILRDDGGAVIPMFASDLLAASDKLQHDKVALNYEIDGCRLAERWWFA